jgi:hypothetical protein
MSAWKLFERAFRAEPHDPTPSRLLDLLAALSHQTNFSVGCYCDNENRCHPSFLKELLPERGPSLRRAQSDWDDGLQILFDLTGVFRSRVLSHGLNEWGTKGDRICLKEALARYTGIVCTAFV